MLVSDPLTTMVCPSLMPAGAGSSKERVFLIIILYISAKIVWKAFSTSVASRAEVSMNESPSFSAKPCASSVFFYAPLSLSVFFFSIPPENLLSSAFLFFSVFHPFFFLFSVCHLH